MKSFVVVVVVTTFVIAILSCHVNVNNAFMALGHIHKSNKNNLSNSPSAFVATSFKKQQELYFIENTPIVLQRQRKSMAGVATQGLFGLGAPEIAIILVAAAFLLGPQKLAELGRDAGKMAGELKEVPKEFQKGIAEGEQEALLMKKEVKKEIEGEGAIVEAVTEEKK